VPFIGQMLGGTGFSLAISTDTSLLRSITECAPEGSFGKFSRRHSYMFLSTLVAGSVGSILFDYEAHWPFYSSILATLIAITCILLIRGDKRAGGSKTSQQKVVLDLDADQNFG
jgi:hypothetical protein